MSQTKDLNRGGPARYYSNDELREWIIVWYETFDCPPRANDFDDCPETPTSETYNRRDDLPRFADVRDAVLEEYLDDYNSPSW